MQANIEDVAQLAGVSIATVSRTFKHPDVVAKKTRDKVLAAANELNFSISHSATSGRADVPYCPIAERSLCVIVQRTNLRGP